ncbi:MAG: hypothetical protein ACOZBZ_00870 [Patescibacteria group bacterium]
MGDGLLIKTTRDFIVVKIPRKLIYARKKISLTVAKALAIFKKGKEEYRRGKLTPVSSLKEIS